MIKFRNGHGNYMLAAAQNRGPLKVFELKRKLKFISLRPDDFSGEVKYTNGQIQKAEFYYGSSFLSESGRFVNIDSTVRSLKITNIKGEVREVKIKSE